ncbi:hypothetical protein IAQ61_002129 [Plenodomus lingam]|uniref:uncharacterized protein n=1 Tax=Leptosphaeria maculans TaxID=5022 RepID=UPI00332489EA|nr:hypothetical protein IAQ61_002129 [Plenodomus lingam]
MPAPLIIVALIVVPLILGAGIAYAAFKACLKRSLPVCHTAEPRRSPQPRPRLWKQRLELRNLKRPGKAHTTFQRSGFADTIVPVHVAPAVQPLGGADLGSQDGVSYPRRGRLFQERKDIGPPPRGQAPPIMRYGFTGLHVSTSKPYTASVEESAALTSPRPLMGQNTLTDVLSPKPRHTVTPTSPYQDAPLTPYDERDNKAGEIWGRTIARQNVTSAQTTNRSYEEEQVAGCDIFVVESDNDGWDDGDTEKEKPAANEKSPGRSLLGRLMTRKWSHGSSRTQEERQTDLEYDEFVNPSNISLPISTVGTEEDTWKTLADATDDELDDEVPNGRETRTSYETNPDTYKFKFDSTARSNQKTQHQTDTQAHTQKAKAPSTSHTTTTSSTFTHPSRHTHNPETNPIAPPSTPLRPLPLTRANTFTTRQPRPFFLSTHAIPPKRSRSHTGAHPSPTQPAAPPLRNSQDADATCAVAWETGAQIHDDSSDSASVYSVASTGDGRVGAGEESQRTSWASSAAGGGGGMEGEGDKGGGEKPKVRVTLWGDPVGV